MRKKKKKYANLIMLLLILFVLFFIVIQNRSVRITSEDLIQSYSSNKSSAEIKYLNKDVELSGKVKLLILSENEKSFLELESTIEKTRVLCILTNKEHKEKVESLTSGTTVIVYGKCLGLQSDFNNDSSNVIYIQTESIR